MKTIKVTITNDDLPTNADEPQRHEFFIDNENCALARAAKRDTGTKNVVVYLNTVIIDGLEYKVGGYFGIREFSELCDKADAGEKINHVITLTQTI